MVNDPTKRTELVRWNANVAGLGSAFEHGLPLLQVALVIRPIIELINVVSRDEG